MKIAIIGAGWYGCHLALVLNKKGHTVVLFEKNSDIFQQISGNFGIRLHSGAHYPRSPATRENCRHDFTRFKEQYPDLVVEHNYAIYGLGDTDASNQPSHVNADDFHAVCEEFPSTELVNTEEWGYQGLLSAHNMAEPSMLVGEPLREKFLSYLKEAEITLHCNCCIQKIEHDVNGQLIVHTNQDQHEGFDKVINATSYQNLLPESLPPFDMEVIYQPCLGLLYEDKKPEDKPFSLIVMDGLFPCLMPYLHEKDGPNTTFLLTHGLYTIMSSNPTVEGANEILNKIDEAFIKTHIQPNCEQEITRFWPAFAERFSYIGWKGAVLAKLKTSSEYRSAITYEKNDIIYIIPGKVSNIFDVEDEVLALLELPQDRILEKEGYRYDAKGALAKGQTEISDHPEPHTRNTGNLQTYSQLTTQSFWNPKEYLQHVVKSEVGTIPSLL